MQRRPCLLLFVALLAAATGHQVRQVREYHEQPNDVTYQAVPDEQAPADAAEEDETHAFGVDAAEGDGADSIDPLMDKFLHSDVGMLASIGINNAARVFGPPDFPKQEAPKDGGYNGKGGGVMLPASEELVLRLQANAALEMLKEDKYPHARCLDGTMGGFYYKAASSSSARDNWLVHLQGGGECDTIRCAYLAQTALGSSNFFALTHSFYGEDLDVRVAVEECDEPGEEGCEGALMATMSDLQVNRRQVNPDFYDWNMVYVPYCSQDLWTGQRTRAVRTSNLTNTTFYFSGLHILDAVVDTLDLTKNMADAQNIIFSGDSAGGYGVLAHLDRLAAKHPNARVVGNPVGGLWQFAHPYRGPRHTRSLFTNIEPRNWERLTKLWKAYIPKSCPYHEVACSVGCSKFPWPWTYIKSPLFIVGANTDTVLATMHNWLPKPARRTNGLHDPHYYMAEERAWLTRFGENMTRCLRSGVKYIHEHTGDKFRIGAFMPSCFSHIYFPDDLRIGTKNYMQAFSDFWHQRDVNHVHIEDGLMKNPTCRNQFYTILY